MKGDQNSFSIAHILPGNVPLLGIKDNKVTPSRKWHNTEVNFQAIHTIYHSVHMDGQVDGVCNPGSTLPKLTA